MLKGATRHASSATPVTGKYDSIDNEGTMYKKSSVVWVAGSAALVLGVLWFVSCSELKTDLPSPISANPIVHEVGWSDPLSAKFHGKFLQVHNWDYASCTTCHAPSFQGGTSGISCSTSGCHVDANGSPKSPQACNTCHGKFNAPAGDLLSFAPPRSVGGDTSSAVRGVGAHQKHLSTGTKGKLVICQECHSIPAQVFAAGHLDSSPSAEVAFNDTLARLVTGSGTFTPNPAYDPATLKCNNTFCHGNWRARKAAAPSQFQYAYVDSIIVGENASPRWTGGSAEASCGSCHGLPPKGHVGPLDVTTCGNSGCHPGVVDGAGNILDKTKHINGKINVLGNQLNF